MNFNGLLKKASFALRSLRDERNDLETQLAFAQSELKKFAAAKELSFKLWKMGAFPAEDIEDQFNDLLQKPHDEINTFEKAASLVKSGSFGFGLGKVSEVPQLNETAEERFISSLLD